MSGTYDLSDKKTAVKPLKKILTIISYPG